MVEITKAFSIRSSWSTEAIVGAAKFGAVFGTFLGGALMLRYGRRNAIAASSVFFTSGPLIMAASTGPGGLIIGRLVVGLGIGCSSLVVPAYLGELAPAKQRGTLVEIYEVMLTVGMLCSVLMDWLLQGVGPGNWRWMVGVPAIPGLVMGLSLGVLPESPRWLVMRNRLDEALSLLERILGPKTRPGGTGRGSPDSEGDDVVVARAEDELMHLWSSVEKDKHEVLERRAKCSKGWPLKAYPLTSGSSPPAAAQPSISMTGHPMCSNNSPYLEFNGDEGSPPRHSTEFSPSPEMALLPLSGSPKRATCFMGEHAVGSSASHVESGTRMLLGGADDQQQLLPEGRRSDWGEHPPAVSQRGPGSCWLRFWRYSSPGKGCSVNALTSVSSPATFAPGEEPSFVHTLHAMLQDIREVAHGPESRAFFIALWLAFFDQACASTAIINYAPYLVQLMGVENDRQAILYTVTVALTKCFGVAICLLTVDRIGRKPLLIYGGLGAGVALLVAVAAVALESVTLLLMSMCGFILSFSVSWAGVYWVLISELFSMSTKSPASSAATAVLFATGAVTNLVFLSLVKGLRHYAFLLFAGISFLSAAYVSRWVPETKEKTLAEIHQMLGGSTRIAG